MSTRTETRLPNWILGTAPLALIALMVLVIVIFDPIASLREVPPVEELAVERTILTADHIEIRVRNDGPDPVTIAQVLVNDAYWNFEASPAELGRLETSTIDVPYPWEEGLPLAITFVTETGVTIGHEIEAASLTPGFDGRTLWVYALLGLYIGVIPIAIGLLWFTSLKRASRRWLTFFLAFTVGLLAFLLVDTVAEGLELAGEAAASLDGTALFFIGAAGAVAALAAMEARTQRSRKVSEGLVLAYLIAAGIGLHNLGEGLAVGAALAAGETALGSFLVLGFALHNTTEGLAIVAPLGSESSRPPLKHFLLLGAVAGVPTIAGAWAGGFAFNAAWAALAFGVAAGAIAQVIWVIWKGLKKDPSVTGVLAGGFMAGVAVMYVTGLFTA